MNELSIAICDDNPLQLDLFDDMLTEYFESKKYPAKITRFESGAELIKAVENSGPFSVTFLDMIMPELDGISTAKKLRQIGMASPIVFVTSSTDFLLESYEIHAFHYLLKPVGAAKLHGVMDDLLSRFTDDDEIVQIHTRTGGRRVELNKINMIERIEESAIYRLSGGEALVSPIRTSFKVATDEIIGKGDFVEAGVSMLVNMAKVAGVDKKNSEIFMDDGSVIRPPVSAIPALYNSWTSRNE